MTAGKSWDVLLVYRAGSQGEEAENIAAALPYMLQSRWGGLVKWIEMPPQTYCGGAWMADGEDAHYVAREIGRKLDELKVDWYRQCYPARSPLPQLLMKEGYIGRELFRYRIEDERENMETIVRHLSKNKSRQLNAAREAGMQVDWELDAEQFYRLHQQCATERNQKMEYSREFLLVLERKTRRLGQSQILCIRDPKGEVAGGAMLVWDQNSMYHQISFVNPHMRDKGAATFLAIEAIRLAKEKGLIFDFGPHHESRKAHHYRQLSGDPTLYYEMVKYRQWWWRWFIKLWDWSKKINN